MSDGEAALTSMAAVASLALWGIWYARLVRRRAMGQPFPGRAIMALAPLACAILIFAVLRTIASFDVVNDPKYIVQYLVLGMAWVGLGTLVLFGWFGISVRDDLLERGNPAVVPVISGGMLGLACCYAGGNVGDGPGWWVVMFAALLSTSGLLVLWGILERVSHLSDAITIDRDAAAGHRLGGFLFGAGIILGRAVAGDWISIGATMRDFVQVASPALLLLALAIVIDRSAHATPEQPEPPVGTQGVMPAIVFPLLAFVYVTWRGLPQ